MLCLSRIIFFTIIHNNKTWINCQENVTMQKQVSFCNTKCIFFLKYIFFLLCICIFWNWVITLFLLAKRAFCTWFLMLRMYMWSTGVHKSGFILFIGSSLLHMMSTCKLWSLIAKYSLSAEVMMTSLYSGHVLTCQQLLPKTYQQRAE